MTKQCWSCKEVKELSEFWKDSHNKVDGKQMSCKLCQTAKNMAYRESHPGYFSERGHNRYQKLIKENPKFNQERYADSKESFLLNRAKSRLTIRGRVSDLFHSAARRSKKKNQEIGFDIEWLLELYESQDGKCALTGQPFDLNKSAKKGHYHPYSPSLDRICSDKGYTKDNVRLICTNANLALNAFGDTVFEKMCVDFLRKKGYDVSITQSSNPKENENVTRTGDSE